jgi:hypothetical protein
MMFSDVSYYDLGAYKSSCFIVWAMDEWCQWKDRKCARAVYVIALVGTGDNVPGAFLGPHL